MRCRPLRWLWGLLPLALLGLVMVLGEQARIEKDLTSRTTAALEDAGFSFAQPQFGGREGVIAGQAVDEEERRQAIEIVRGTWGVRNVEDRLALIDEVRPYVWSAMRDGNRLRLEGYVPGDDERRNVVELARERFPGLQIDDRMQLGRGEPRRTSFLEGIRFGFDQLVRLDTGDVRLEDLELSLAGVARSTDDFDTVNGELQRKLPRGVTLGQNDVRAPAISPYPFSASLKASKLVLEGFLPDAQLRDRLLRQLKQRLPRAAVTDRTKIGGGEPRQFEDAASAVIDHLAMLEEGEAGLTDTDVELSGVAKDQDVADQAVGGLKSALPASFRLSDRVTFLKPRERTVEAYAWSAGFTDKSLVLEGFIPSEEARTSLVAEAKRRIPGVRIVDLTEVARGEPPRFLEAALTTLDHLSRLKKGTASFAKDQLTFDGLAVDEDRAGEIDASLRRSLPSEFTVAGAVTFEKARIATVDPYRWSARLSEDGVVLEGYVPDETTRADLLKSAERDAPGGRATDLTEVARGEPADFAKAARASLEALVRLKSGEARIERDTLVIEGLAVDEATARDLSARLKSSLPRRIRLEERITIAKPALATVNPYTFSADYEDGRLVLEGQVPSEDVRAAILARAARSHPGVEITDRLALALGHPGTQEEWRDAAGYAIDQLAAMKRGRARIEGNQLSLEGEAIDIPGYDAIQAALTRAPRGTRIREAKVTRPIAATYVWQLSAKGDTIVLEGQIPSEETRRKIFDYAAQRFAGRNLTDRMEIFGGVPEPERDWLRVVQTGIRAVSILGEGRAVLTGRELSIEGETRVEAVPGRIEEIVRTAMPSGYDGRSQVAYVGPSAEEIAAEDERKTAEEADRKRAKEELAAKAEQERLAAEEKAKADAEAQAVAEGETQEYRFDATYDGLELDLEGTVPTEASRAAVIAAAKRKLPDRTIKDRLEVRDGAPDGWVDAILKALDPLTLLEKGKIAIRKGLVRLNGEADSDAMMARARRMLEEGLPQGYGGENEVVLVPPPTPDPDVVARKQAEEKVDVDVLLQSSDKLDAGDCQAVLNTMVRRGQVLFATAKFELDRKSKKTLGALPDIAQRCPDMRIAIAGHTDSDGAAKYNQWLSERRAEAVVGYLAGLGMDRSRMSAIGYGEMQPIANNDTKANKARNRRIELEVSIQ